MSQEKIPRSIENSQMEITWINSAVNKSLDAYFRAFEMSEKRSAHRRYTRLLGSGSNLSEVDRKKLMDNFQ